MKVLFLSNNDNTKPLYEWLTEQCEIVFWDKKFDVEILNQISPDLIISYNYVPIIKKEIIEKMNGNIINLHISYLPWNKGLNPNYWSFVENTPKGVTIHQISEGIDEGKIIYQRELKFDVSEETFESTYKKLHQAMRELFIDNWDNIKNKNYALKEQSGKGNYHSKADFENMVANYPVSWSENIGDYLEKISQM